MTHTLSTFGSYLFCLLFTTTLFCQVPDPPFIQLGEGIHGEHNGDQSGSSLALSDDGNRLAILTGPNPSNSTYTGNVRIFEWTGLDWAQMGSTIYAENPNEDIRNQVSLSADGTHVAIYFWDHPGGSGESFGRIRVFQWNGQEWLQLGSTLETNISGDFFGNSISLSDDGSQLVVGARFSDNFASNSGLARVYQWDGNNWTQLGQDLGGAVYHEFGAQTMISGDGQTVVITTGQTEQDGQQVQHTIWYQWDEIQWNQLGQPFQSIVGGSAISADGQRMAVGNALATANPDLFPYSSGVVQIFERQNDSWIQLGEDLFGTYGDEYFGSAISLDHIGNRLAVGAFWNGEYEYDGGRTAVYDWNGTTWTQLENNIYGELFLDQCGYEVVLSGDGTTLATSSVLHDVNVDEKGKVRVFWLDDVAFAEPIVAICAASDPQSNEGMGRPRGGVYSGVGITDDGNGRTFTMTAETPDLSSGIMYEMAEEEDMATIEVHDLPMVSLGLPDTLFVTAGTSISIPGTGLPVGGVYEDPSGLFNDDANGLTFSYSGVTIFEENQTINYTYIDEFGCENTSMQTIILFDQTVDVVDLSELSISVYPNPTTDVIQIDGATTEVVQLTDQMGRLVWHYQGTATKVDLTQLPKGVYTLLIGLEDKRWGSTQVVKE